MHNHCREKNQSTDDMRDAHAAVGALTGPDKRF